MKVKLLIIFLIFFLCIAFALAYTADSYDDIESTLKNEYTADSYSGIDSKFGSDEVTISSYLFNVSDSLTLSDLTSRQGSFSKEESESFSISEVTINLGSYFKELSQSLSFNELSKRAGSLFKKISDLFSFNEITDRITSIFRIGTDSVTFNELLTRLGIIIREPEQSLSFNEITKRIGIFSRTISDSFSFNEIAKRTASFFRIVFNYITFTFSVFGAQVDTTLPVINIAYPEAITYSANVSDLNYTYVEVHPDSCWYSTGGANSSAVTMGDNFTDLTSVAGSNTWTVYCNDTFGNIGTDSVTFNLNEIWYNANYPFTNKSFRITEFVEVDGTSFTLGGEPYALLGTDSYYLADYATNHTYDDDGNEINNSRQAVLEILNEANYLNMNVLRTWANMQGGEDSHWERNQSGGHWNLFEVNEPGNYSEEMFEALDWVIYEASKRDIRLQLVLINNWNDYGGMRWYVQQSPTTDKTYENVSEDEHPTYYWSEFHDQFYTDENCQQYYEDFISYLLNRNNTYSGILYKNDPAIFSWLLANEPRAKSDGTGRDLIKNWATNMTAYIKSIDSNHLVGLGIEGWGVEETWGEGTDMIADHETTGVDFATYALHPDQWKYFAESSEHDGGGLVTEGTGTNAYIDWWTTDSGLSYNNKYHLDDTYYLPDLGRYGYDNWVEQNVAWVNDLGMPILLQEAGYKTDHTKAIKDRFYEQMIHNFYSSGGDGLMFWTLNHDDYYYSTDINGTMDDGYGFYVSTDPFLKNKSESVLDAVDFTKTDNSGGSWVRALNDYKYDFIINLGTASDTVIKNATLHLNISNDTW